MKDTTLTIVLDGGIVQGVSCEKQGVPYRVIEFDDNGDKDGFEAVTNAVTGQKEQAYISHGQTGAPAWLTGSEQNLDSKEVTMQEALKSQEVEPDLSTAAYLMKGALVNLDAFKKAVESDLSGGEIEFVSYIMSFSPKVDAFFETVSDDVGYVFPYDVVEPLGAFMVSQFIERGDIDIDVLNATMMKLHQEANG